MLRVAGIACPSMNLIYNHCYRCFSHLAVNFLRAMSTSWLLLVSTQCLTSVHYPTPFIACPLFSTMDWTGGRKLQREISNWMLVLREFLLQQSSEKKNSKMILKILWLKKKNKCSYIFNMSLKLFMCNVYIFWVFQLTTHYIVQLLLLMLTSIFLKTKPNPLIFFYKNKTQYTKSKEITIRSGVCLSKHDLLSLQYF